MAGEVLLLCLEANETPSEIISPPDMKTNPYLPNELVEEILSRLPAKSLMKFKWVSKSWLSLISCPQFIKTHLAIASGRDDCHSLILTVRCDEDEHFHLRQCSVSSVLYVGTAATTPTTELADIGYPIGSPGKSMVVGSCNGLVCTSFEEKYLFLWNPCTQKCKKLPDIRVEMGDDDYCMNFGFGYDEMNDDCKVVSLFCTFTNGPEYEIEVKVYSLKKNTWSRIGDINGCILLLGPGAYANGNLHWTANFGGGSWKIVTLDLANETYEQIGIPNVNCNVDNIGVLGGCLSMLCCDHVTFGAEVWVMKEYGVNDSWTKLIFFSYLDYLVVTLATFCYGFSFPVCALRDGKVLLVLGGGLVLYDPKSNTCRWYPQTSVVKNVSLFVESLVSPDLYLEEPRQL